MSTLDQVQQSLLIEGLEDDVGLWQVARRVRDVVGDATPDAVREAAVQRLHDLLILGYIVAGDSPYITGEFRPWVMSADATADRIDREWRALDRDPTISEICWFRNTDLGNEIAASLPE